MDRHLYLLLVHGSISISERAGAPHWATPIRQSSMFAILLGQFFTVIVWSVMLCVYSIFCALCYCDTSESPKGHFFRVGWPLGSSLVVTFERCLRANNRNRTEIPKGITLLRPQETLVGQIAILNKSPLVLLLHVQFFQEVFLLNITLSFSAASLWICGQFFLLFHWQAQTSKERQKSFFAAMLLDITRVRRW